MTIIEGLEFVLRTLKWAVNPYPELISAGWGHVEASLWVGLLYFTFGICFIVLIEMYQRWRGDEINKDE